MHPESNDYDYDADDNDVDDNSDAKQIFCYIISKFD